MAYEVVKTISGRPYRYRVESRRDPESGRVKNKWTYLGKGEPSAPVVKRRGGAEETRASLIAAFVSLVETLVWAKVTPGAIARAAGLAPATFYRHFRDRNELVTICTDEANARLDERLGELQALCTTLEAERARVHAWVIDLFERRTASPGILRLWTELAVMVRMRELRRSARVTAFAAYIEELRERGFAPIVGPVRPLAIALSFELETLGRRESSEGGLLCADDFAAAAETFDRLLFWRPPEAR